MNFNKKLTVAVSGAVLLMAGQFALADSTTDIVDALVSKGVLTEEEGKLISKGHETKKKAEGNIGFKNGFKINSGDGKSNFSVNGRIQADYRYFQTPETISTGTPTGAANADTFDIRRAYLGVKGTFRNWINFEATLDGVQTAYIKYFWLETAFSEKVKLRIGQFKPGFGLEQLTSSRFIDMTERDWAATIAPGVNKGIMLHGTPATGFTYALGYNNGSAGTYIADSSQKVIESSNNGDGKQLTARVTANIAEIIGNKEAIMHIGVDYATDNDAPTSAAGSLVFRTNARGTNFFGTLVRSGTAMFTSPDITRYGLEGIGAWGPVKLQAEYAQMDISETGNAVIVPHADANINASYVNLSYMLTGEKYADAYKNGIMDRMSPKNDYNGLGSAGMGAWELGLRYSRFDAHNFISGTDYTANSSTPAVDSYTAGIKWIADPNTRFMLNYVYTDFNKSITGTDATSGAATAGTPLMKYENAINLRGQFDF